MKRKDDRRLIFLRHYLFMTYLRTLQIITTTYLVLSTYYLSTSYYIAHHFYSRTESSTTIIEGPFQGTSLIIRKQYHAINYIKNIDKYRQGTNC